MIVTLSALLLGAMQTGEPLRIELGWNGSVCSTVIEGRTTTVGELANAITHWARRGRPISVISAANIPYRCIGSTIFALQAANYRISADIGQPPLYQIKMETLVQFTVASGACAYRVNGEPIAEGDLPALMADWKLYEVVVQLKPEAKAGQECVGTALALIQRAGVWNMGFFGSDQEPTGEPEVAPR